MKFNYTKCSKDRPLRRIIDLVATIISFVCALFFPQKQSVFPKNTKCFYGKNTLYGIYRKLIDSPVYKGFRAFCISNYIIMVKLV